MTFLWINLVLVFMFSFFARYFSNTEITSFSTIAIKPNKLLVFCTLISLALISGLRNNIGDTYFYMHAYEFNDFTWEFIKSQKDIGFGILQMQLKKLSTDPQILIFTTALITNVLIIFVLYKYSRIFELSMYVYITGGLFLVTMNGIRQTLAAAIIFTATKFLIRGDWKKYFLVIIFASFFHQSALILIPIYFVVRSKAWSKATIALVALAVIIVLGFNQFSALLFSAIQDTQYSEYQNFNEGGANILRVAVNAGPLLVAFLGRDKLRRLFPNSDPIVNMALIGCVFMLISTQNWIFARFAIYFSLYQLIVISWIVKLFREKDEKLIYYAILVFYFIYYYYENVISLGIFYKSDYLNLIP
ncbi:MULTISPECIES: EpsG family protein [Priestia]|uniref:EpsG family protein n=1 Tax=Priestia TaxID=2800373 RepID=UPI001C8E1E0A|nr:MULTISPECIES: EpsG family protein [Priestia]MBY0061798.1 EpsG family protein [Priestia aryabhattai]MDN3362345.1 EpsG family protein [Priestia megaterium]